MADRAQPAGFDVSDRPGVARAGHRCRRPACPSLLDMGIARRLEGLLRGDARSQRARRRGDRRRAASSTRPASPATASCRRRRSARSCAISSSVASRSSTSRRSRSRGLLARRRARAQRDLRCAACPYTFRVPESDTLVFIPAWNEEENLPAVLDELHDRARRSRRPRRRRRLDRRNGRPSRARTARRSFVRREPRTARGNRRRLRVRATSTATSTSAASTPTASIPSTSSRACSRSFAADDADVAVGSRFATGDGYEAYRYEPSREQPVRHIRSSSVDGRCARPAVPRRHERDVRREPARASRTECPYTSGAPEVESLLRLREAGLRVVEVPVHMRERASGESKLRGGKAVRLVVTVVSTLLLTASGAGFGARGDAPRRRPRLLRRGRPNRPPSRMPGTDRAGRRRCAAGRRRPLHRLGARRTRDERGRADGRGVDHAERGGCSSTAERARHSATRSRSAGQPAGWTPARSSS